MQNKLFWLKSSLFLAMKCQPTKLSNVYLEYLKIMADVLPSEVENIENIYYSAKVNIVSVSEEPSKKSIPVQPIEIVS